MKQIDFSIQLKNFITNGKTSIKTDSAFCDEEPENKQNWENPRDDELIQNLHKNAAK